MQVKSDLKCQFCRGEAYTNVFTYHAPPKDEVAYSFAKGKTYYREVLQCQGCKHLISIHEMGDQAIYEGDYVSSTYGDREALKRTFERITSLPPEKSDNGGRCRHIQKFAQDYFSGATQDKSILDVGSGLCVFLAGMKPLGWKGTALDPDKRSAEHAKAVVGVDAICADFMKHTPEKRFDAITFNKVLEHVTDPVTMLAKAKDYLAPGGFVYVELPDGEVAMRDGSDREEFAIDHHHIFSMTSISLLADHAGFETREIERLKEPSTKYTLRSFLVVKE